MSEQTGDEAAWNEAEDEAAALWVARHLDDEVDARAFALWRDGEPGRAARFDALWASCMDKAVTLGLRAQACDPDAFAGRAVQAANDDDDTPRTDRLA
ncbi:hypothetical protein MTR62_12385, partial [Novosphingobium sp. 1949]|nr:hypothetical protein [Novosphingobium organovorum]